jgi:hypothetical protein
MWEVIRRPRLVISAQSANFPDARISGTGQDDWPYVIEYHALKFQILCWAFRHNLNHYSLD